MMPLIRQLFQHQAWADAEVLRAIKGHSQASADAQLRKTLQHMVATQQFFLSLFLKQAFDSKRASDVPGSFEQIAASCRTTHEQEIAFVETLSPDDVQVDLDIPALNSRPNLGEALMQVVTHSASHRGQCISRLRDLGADLPPIDFIHWVKDRPAPVW